MFLKIVINNQRCTTKPLKFVVIFKIQCHVSIFSHYMLSFSCISAIYAEAGMANLLFFFYKKQNFTYRFEFYFSDYIYKNYNI